MSNVISLYDFTRDNSDSVTIAERKLKSSEPLYFDEQPELVSVVRDWLESLKIDCGVAWDDGEIEPIECRARDGFWPYSHNKGGFDFTLMSDVNHCNGSGSGPNLSAIESEAEGAYRDAKAEFIRQNAEALKGIPEDKVNYHDLYDLGHSCLAEALSEMESDFMRTGVRWGVRAMYEGSKHGIHTLCLYASGNVSEYYSAFGNGSVTLGEWELRFRTVSGLKRQLQRLKRKVEGVF